MICLVALVTSDIGLRTSNIAYAQSDAEHQQFLFAYKLMQRKENVEAAAAFDEYLGKFPNGDKLGDAQYYRAMLFRRAKDNNSAVKLLEKAAKPTIVPEYAVKLLQGQIYSDLKQPKQALGVLEQIKIDEVDKPIAFATHLMKGNAYRATGNFKAAEAALLEAVKLPTANKPHAMLTLATTQRQMKENAKAIKTLDELLAMSDPKTAPVAARMAGDLSYNEGQHAKAIDYYNTVITKYQATEHFGPSMLGLMWAQFGDGQHAAVLKTYGQASKVLPDKDKPTTAYLAGSARQELGEYEEAVKLLRSVAQSGGSSSIREKAMYKLALSLYELKQYDAMNAAVKSLNTAFPRSELRIDAAFLQANAEAETGKIEQGIARLTEFIKQGPDASSYYGQALLQRAHLYEKHKKLDAAIGDYDAYLGAIDKPTPTSLQARFRLMELLGATGQHERVEKLAQDVLKLEDASLLKPEIEQEALYRLAVAHRFQNDLAKAMATHEQLMNAHPINPYAAESVYEQGLIRVTQGNTEAGVAQLLEAADTESLALPSRVSALRVVAQHAVDTNKTSEALKLRLKMQTLAGDKAFNDEERLWLGETLIDTGSPEKALDYLTAVTNEKLLDRAKLMTGRALRLTGSADNAMATLNEVRATSERYALDAWLEIALLYRDVGEYEGALRELAALQNPDRGQQIASKALYEGGLIHKTLAMEKLRGGQKAAEADLKAARDALKKLWLLYPDRKGESLAKRGYLHLAALQRLAGQAEAEIQSLSELIEAEPDTPFATLAKAALAQRAGKTEQSEAYLRQLRNEAKDDAVLIALARELITAGE